MGIRRMFVRRLHSPIATAASAIRNLYDEKSVIRLRNVYDVKLKFCRIYLGHHLKEQLPDCSSHAQGRTRTRLKETGRCSRQLCRMERKTSAPLITLCPLVWRCFAFSLARSSCSAFEVETRRVQLMKRSKYGKPEASLTVPFHPVRLVSVYRVSLILFVFVFRRERSLFFWRVRPGAFGCVLHFLVRFSFSLILCTEDDGTSSHCSGPL